MTHTPTPLDPIAQLVAKYQSNGQTTSTQQTQTAAQSQPKKDWIGFRGKTLWDWLNFIVQLVGVVAIPIVIFWASGTLTAQQNAASQSQRDSDQMIADNQFQESILKTFRDDIDHLVFDQHLLTAKRGDPVQVMAQSYTDDALRKLDLPRRVLLVRFIAGLHLLNSDNDAYHHSVNGTLVELRGVDLHEANLARVDLRGAVLQFADLSGANLIGVNLSGADLSRANMTDANLPMANLSMATLRWTNLSFASLVQANLSGAELFMTNLSDANLSGANLSGTYLSARGMPRANLKGARALFLQKPRLSILGQGIIPRPR